MGCYQSSKSSWDHTNQCFTFCNTLQIFPYGCRFMWYPLDGFELFRNRDKSDKLKRSSKVTIRSASLKHGDMLYLIPCKSPSVTPDSSSEEVTPLSTVKEDEIDIILAKEDGKITRSRDEQLCRHGANAKCVHCVPLEPYNEQYLLEHDPPIKHLSFHSHLRKLMGGVDKKVCILENPNCKIKPGCTEHAPWPAGICTKCQPSAITLDRQTFRHVDNVMFENPKMFDRFLDYWRKTGKQRIGFLYGNYEVHKDVPLGIRATVSAIYEPPQVGWIFTDLLADDLTKGTVKHVRNLEPSKQIHTEAYQVSNQCMSLVQDNCLVPTKDAAELGYIKESTSQQYVPDVFYSQTDSYGNKSKLLARPLPVEFLLVDVPSAFALEPLQSFNPLTTKELFPIENRSDVGDIQDMSSLAKYMKQFTSDEFLEAMLDFHLLIYLASMDVYPLRDHMDPLLEALKHRDKETVQAWSKGEQWLTVEHFMDAHDGTTHSGGPSSTTNSQQYSVGSWTCSQCTYINAVTRGTCEICDGPRR
ncbi:putative nuclear protein localization protein 4-like [Apostichopus japonicus]|uniref:Putative nuclear protein localization protein 4-like n=1 Tax=Stichopus japonicus TaxID=307972 RepID=A0A2G8JFC0_STIJA|nr:putative nuclear protein localization protein 4-like [Apostichopus japonicus]